MTDYYLLAQNAAEDRWLQCVAALMDDEPMPEGAMYCGCDTCSVREILTAAWPHLRMAARVEFANELETILRTES